METMDLDGLVPSEGVSGVFFPEIWAWQTRSPDQERLTIVSTLMLVASTYSFGVGLPRESADFLEGLVYLTLSAMAREMGQWGNFSTKIQ